MNRKTAILALAVTLISVSATTASAEAPSVAVRVTPARETTLEETKVAYGALEPDPDQVLSLSLPHAGLINRVWVRLGLRVRRGDKLVEVVTAPDSHMQYLQAQSGADFALREFSRQQRLMKEQLSTRSQVDSARKTLEDARARLDALRRRGMGKTEETLRAPMDGIVTRIDVTQGQRVQADTSAMLIATETRLIARLGVEPEEVHKITADLPVTIVPVFVPEVRMESRIREVHAMIDPVTRLVEVLVPIPEARTGRLVLGSRVIGRIHLASHRGLVVPRSAVLHDDAGAYLFTLSNGKARRVDVKTGIEQNGWVEVSGGIHLGDGVVSEGNYELADGMAAREIAP